MVEAKQTHHLGRALAAASLLLSSCAWATFEATPYVGYTIEYDDNVLRHQDADEAALQSPTGDRRLEDTRHQTAAGLAARYRLGKQELFFDGSLFESRYDHFDELDFDGNILSGGANWAIGNALTGDIQGQRTKDLREFDTFSIQTERSVQTTTQAAANIALRVLSEVELRSGYSNRRVRNSLLAARGVDLDEDAVNAGIAYLGIGKLELFLNATFIDGEFTERVIDAEYEQSEVSLQTVWSPSESSSLDALVGVTSREDDFAGGDDYDELVASLGFTHVLSPKTNLFAGYYRNVSSSEIEGENSVLRNGLNTSLSWAPRAGLEFDLEVLGQMEDYQVREDRFYSVSLGSDYGVGRYVALRPNLTWAKRTSNQDIHEFDSFSVGLEIRLQYEIR